MAAAMFNDLSSPRALLATRRSGKPRDMVAPGPDSEQLRRILGSAMRVPDHGKLAPWRFVVVPADRRAAFAALLGDALNAERPDASARDRDAADQFAHQAPVLVAVISCPRADSPIPLWEQELSGGAACFAMLAAAHAEGFVAGWLTGWAATSPAVAAGLGHPGARVAGFIFMGTAARPPEERPRPDPALVCTTWAG